MDTSSLLLLVFLQLQVKINVEIFVQVLLLVILNQLGHEFILDALLEAW